MTKAQDHPFKLNSPSRREFIQISSAAALGTTFAASLSTVPGAYAAGSDMIRVGLIGCGGRGTGAADNVISAAPGVKIVAMADAFKDRLDQSRKELLGKTGEGADRFDVPDNRTFVGLDAYQRLLALPDVNYVILATPPGFRPVHLEAAVAAGKNIFTEKPVGVDGPGIRKVLAAYEQAKSKNLAIAAGTQRRHQSGYQEIMKRIHDSHIGEIIGARCSAELVRPRIPDAQLALLHLALRRSHRRAACSQHRRRQLGEAGSPRARRRNGWASVPYWQ